MTLVGVLVERAKVQLAAVSDRLARLTASQKARPWHTDDVWRILDACRMALPQIERESASQLVGILAIREVRDLLVKCEARIAALETGDDVPHAW